MGYSREVSGFAGDKGGRESDTGREVGLRDPFDRGGTGECTLAALLLFLDFLPFHPLFSLLPQGSVTNPVTDLWLHLCPQMDSVGAKVVAGEKRSRRIPLNSNKDYFSILISCWGLSPDINPTPISKLPLKLLPPKPAAGQCRDGRRVAVTCFAVVYLGFAGTH